MADLLRVNASTPSEAIDGSGLDGSGLTDEQAKALAITIADAADDRKAADIKILQVGDVSYLADYFVIATGFSNVQVRAIARSIEAAVQSHWQRKPLNTEGVTEGRWVLQDYGEVIVHIFQPREREFYDLDAFWGHAEQLGFTPKPAEAIEGYQKDISLSENTLQ